MVKVNPMEDKDFEAKGNYFGVGVYEVLLEKLVAVTPEKGSPYINVSVLGEEDQTTDIRLYTSEAAAPYTIANLARIAVHNKDTEEAKQKVRDTFKKIDDTDRLTDKFLANMEKMQAWIMGEEDTNAPKPNGGFYIRYSLYSYPPTPKKQTAADLVEQFKNDANSAPVDVSEIPFE